MYDVVLRKTIVINNCVEFEYTYPEEWNFFIKSPDEKLYFEYDFDITKIPVR